MTKAQRFRILRRDGFACRYCGARAPDVLLEVDHLIPVSAGGGDDSTNLVASCEDCNRGKSAQLVPEILPEKALTALKIYAVLRSRFSGPADPSELSLLVANLGRHPASALLLITERVPTYGAWHREMILSLRD